MILICGRWTKCISSNTAPAAACGFHRTLPSPWSDTIRDARAWAISVPCVYVMVASCTARESERFNAQTCWDFFKQLERTSTRRGRRVVVIADNAKYHHAKLHREWRAARTARFAFDFLPPYSPELNPIERVWKLVRRMRLHNRYFGSLDEMVETVEEVFGQWGHRNDTLRRLCALV